VIKEQISNPSPCNTHTFTHTAHDQQLNTSPSLIFCIPCTTVCLLTQKSRLRSTIRALCASVSMDYLSILKWRTKHSKSYLVSFYPTRQSLSSRRTGVPFSSVTHNSSAIQYALLSYPYGPSTRQRALKLQRFCPFTLNGVTSRFAELHCGSVPRFKS